MPTSVLLALTPALRVNVPSVVVAPAAGEVLQLPQAPGMWGTAISPDVAAILLVAAGLLLIAAIIGVVLATRAQRRREGPIEKDRATPANLDEFAIAHWIEESRRFLNLWQERIEHLDELRGRLTADGPRGWPTPAQVSQSDELRAENLRLSQEGEALLLERDQLRAVLTRIGELIQRVVRHEQGALEGRRLQKVSREPRRPISMGRASRSAACRDERPTVRISGAYKGARVIPRRRDSEEQLRTGHAIGNCFDDNGATPAAAALTSAANAAEIVEETQERTPASTGSVHGYGPPSVVDIRTAAPALSQTHRDEHS